MKNFFVESFIKTSSIYHLKEYISDKKSIPIDRIVLTYNKQEINDNEVFSNITPTYKNEYDFYLSRK